MSKQRFILLASQRTGSNVLNQNLNQYPGLFCHNEVFNPAFVGLRKDFLERLGGEEAAKAARDADPLAFRDALLAMTETEVVGYHLFPGHLQAVINADLRDPAVRKICLRRSLFQSFVSLRIAQQTNIWLVHHGKDAIAPSAPVKIRFEPNQFERYENDLRVFWNHVFQTLKETGQECFSVWYKQVNDLETLNQCAAFIGLPDRLETLAKTLKKQNPESLADKVENYAELEAYACSRGMESQLF